jgi:hypothetical protein
MKKYRVVVPRNIDEILDHIRKNPQTTKWPSQNFYCQRSAEYYAFLVAMATGKQCLVEEVNADRYHRLRQQLKHILKTE